MDILLSDPNGRVYKYDILLSLHLNRLLFVGFFFLRKLRNRKREEEKRREEKMRAGLDRDYIVGDEIGRGKFGIVYLCKSITTGESYAVKSIDKTSIVDQIDLDAVEKESKLMQLVSGHSSIVGFHAVYEDAISIHLVLELCAKSDDLYSRITGNDGPMSEYHAAQVMRPLMDAIAHCHSRGVAHRDIKPDNILFSSSDNDDDRRLKVADFGSAGFFGEGRGMEGLVGTPYYVAPEVVAGRVYGEKVDVWSAGVILYIMLAGIPPFGGESAVQVFEQVLRGSLRFPPSLFRNISSNAKDLLRRMIHRDVSRRFSADQVLSTVPPLFYFRFFLLSQV